MRALFLVVLYAGLCYASSDSDADEVETLMDNVLVLKRSKGVSRQVNVTVSCGGAYENQDVVWKKDGEIVAGLLGNNIKVLVKEVAGGNYSCHLRQNGEYLNHTVILVQLENKTVILEKSPGKGEIQCVAVNYNGSFHCSWNRTQHRTNAAVLLVKVERGSVRIPCELDADGSGIHCKENRCPFEEEQNSISLTIYIHNFSVLEAYRKSFYLRDIVKPETLPDLQLGDGKVFSWSYPESWEVPRTFFALDFQVKIVKKNHSCESEEIIMNNTTQDTNYQVKVKSPRFVFCVRAQDKYTKGVFSNWSQCKVDKGKADCPLTGPKP
ncbi:interleukin-12 subunit beta [Trematomus bernacchii]|uniref:interleukin-12 subunit beta n=1 Tax=Trematomus bernacchii TaxID=40690 RepID=UPI00146EA77D|nr:interleukin-12 subunit beta [Trematomus bernacchii]